MTTFLTTLYMACILKNNINEKKRCSWVDLRSDIYCQYHDQQWGVPVYDDEILFEMLILENFQAGLSWLTVLKKRESFREAFDQFDPQKIIAYGEVKEAELMSNSGIIRNRLKIKSAIQNAKVFLEIQKEWGSFSAYLWHFIENQVIRNTDDAFRATSPLSDQISKDLKKKGMKFVGSVIMYSYLQAVGVINDHETTCFCY